MLTAWIPLDDCPEGLGPLVIVDKSHGWSRKLDRRQFSFHQQDMSLADLSRQQLGDCAKTGADCAEARASELSSLSLSARQLSQHRRNRPRIALAVHLQDGSNHYRVGKRADGRAVQLFNDLICARTPSGYPDYSDDTVFPLLYSETPCHS